MSLLQQPTAPLARRGLEAIPSSSSSTDATDTQLTERWAWTLVWLGVLTGGINLWGFWWSSPLTVVLAAALVLGGIAGMAGCWLASSPRAAWLQRCALGGVLAVAALPQAIIIHTQVFYTTDSAAFEDVSAHALVHGVNPYTVSMSAARPLLAIPDRFWTYTVAGGHVAHTSYPAGSFLLDVPAILLGLHHHAVDWVDLGAWLVTGALLFVLMPASLRWLAALVTMTPIFVGMFGNSGTDATFLPFLVLAVWRWDRFALGKAAGRGRFIGPVALGLACAVKQLPWFCVPFLLIGVTLEARRHGRRAAPVALAYAAPVVGVFALVNLPFVVWQPGAWLHGTLTPFIDSLVADGQGLVTLATHGLTGGVALGPLNVAGALAVVSVVIAFALWYPALKLRLKTDFMEPAHLTAWKEPAHPGVGFLGSMQAELSRSYVGNVPFRGEPVHWFDPGYTIAAEEAILIHAIDEVYPELRLTDRITAGRQAARARVRPEIPEPAHYRQLGKALESEQGQNIAAEITAILRRYGY